jgi:hypothetical protein
MAEGIVEMAGDCEEGNADIPVVGGGRTEVTR